MDNLKHLYNYALSLVGVPYRWGGSNPISGFDCSGLVQEILAAGGYDIPGDQNAQAFHDHFVKTGTPNVLGLGALVFYGTSVKEINHIQFMLSDKLAIGANGGGSKTVNASEADKASAFVKVRPYDYRKDIVAIVMPKY
jgi:cell wall-associated NlpC family hydrolase